MSISHGSSNEIGEVDRAFDISKIFRPVLGAWQISWAPTIEKSNARIAPSLLSVGEREVLRWRKMEMFIPINNENGRMPIMMQLMLSTYKE